MATRLTVEEGDGIRQIVALFKAMPERLDKDMRASFRKVAEGVRDDARAKARSQHPQGMQRRKRKGAYKWSRLVNSITSGSDSDTPTMKLGSASVPGWAGWEFGSDRFPQFGERHKPGRFFFPTVMEAIPDMNERVKEIVDDYLDLFAQI